MNAKDRYQKARIAMHITDPFFALILLHLKHVEDSTVPTACTDGRTLRWNPEYIQSLNDAELRGLLAEEAGHCAHLHPIRMESRDHEAWNVACDYAVMGILDNYSNEQTKQGRPKPFEFPDDVCLDHKYDGLSAEEIYNLVPRNPNPQKSGKGSGKGSSKNQHRPRGEVESPKLPKAEEQKLQAKWEQAITQATWIAKQQGALPGEFEKQLSDILNPPASCWEVLREFVSVHARDDYSWTRPNPRYAHSGFILPSMHSERIGKIAIGFDVSGSVYGEIVDRFAMHIRHILQVYRPESTKVIQCDAEIQDVRDYEPEDMLDIKIKGGGGTDFRPVFNLLDKDPPVCLIYLTDLYGTFPKHPPSYPVLWATVEHSQVAPWGVTLKIK